jgi:HK97 family phage portal protein
MSLISRLFQKEINGAVAQQVASLYNQNVFRWMNDDQPVMKEDSYDYIRNGFMSVGAVFECIDLIYKKVVAAPKVVYEIKDEALYQKFLAFSRHNTPESQFLAKQMKAASMEEVKVPRIQKLLKTPNKRQTGDEFFRFITGMYLITGNTYIYGNGSNNADRLWNEMFALPDMHIISGGMMDPVKEYYLNYNTERAERFPAEQIAHMKTFNPDYSTTGSQLYGMPPLRAYNMSLQRNREGNLQANKQMRNGGAFGVISPKNKEDQFEKNQKKALHERMTDAYRSNDPLARIFPSTVPLEWSQIGLAIADLDLFKGLELTDSDVYRAFHVPLTYRSMEGSTFNNKSTDGKQLIYNGVAPICDAIGDTLTRFVCEPYQKVDKKTYVIRICYEDLPEMAADMKELVDWLDKAWWITPNQKLETMGWGKSKEVGMDTIWMPSGYKPIEDALISPEEFNRAFTDATNTNL